MHWKTPGLDTAGYFIPLNFSLYTNKLFRKVAKEVDNSEAHLTQYYVSDSVEKAKVSGTV